MTTNAVILDAVERVAASHDESLVVRSARDSNLWVQVSRVEGESALLCEAVGDEYRGRHRELAAEAVDKLKALGWQDVPAADFTLCADAETVDQRTRLAGLLERTLVTVLGHDPAVPPRRLARDGTRPHSVVGNHRLRTGNRYRSVR
jgi:T3SS (YopN, CesT) and YbjN peptide-binding chaperone 3